MGSAITTTGFSVGQKVRIIGDSRCNGNVGDTGTVIKNDLLHGGSVRVEVDVFPRSWYVAPSDLIHVGKSNRSHAGTVLQRMKRCHNSDVLKHLIKRGNLSQYEANSMYRVTRLASRVHELRSKGITITPETRYDLTGKRYVRYFLK